MKFSCFVDKLKTKVLIADRLSGKNITLPILNSLLINVYEGVVKITSTNLEVGVEFSIKADVKIGGKTAVSSNKFSNFINSLEGGDKLNIELIENTLSLSTNKTTAIFKTLKTEDYPLIPKPKNGTTIKIPVKTLVDGIRSVYFSSSTSDIKPEIASVLIYTNNNRIFFVATDSFRLAEKSVELKDLNIEQILIPFRNAIEITRVFDGYDEEAILEVDKNQISISLDDVYFTTRLTDGIYPNYRQIIPASNTTQVTVLKNDLINTLKQVSIFLDEFNKLSIKIAPEDNNMEFESKNPDVGETVSKIDAHLKGEPIEMSFNYKYLTEVMPILNTDTISLEFNKPNKPMIISPTGDGSFKYLIMPVYR